MAKISVFKDTNGSLWFTESDITHFLKLKRNEKMLSKINIGDKKEAGNFVYGPVSNYPTSHVTLTFRSDGKFIQKIIPATTLFVSVLSIRRLLKSSKGKISKASSDYINGNMDGDTNVLNNLLSKRRLESEQGAFIKFVETIVSGNESNEKDKKNEYVMTDAIIVYKVDLDDSYFIFRGNVFDVFTILSMAKQGYIMPMNEVERIFCIDPEYVWHMVLAKHHKSITCTGFFNITLVNVEFATFRQWILHEAKNESTASQHEA